MSAQPHIGRALSGALALARFDRAGMEYFDFSYDGFWRSFMAVVIALPVVIASSAVMPEVFQRMVELQPEEQRTAVHVPQSVLMFTLAETAGFAAGWLFFPLAMIWVARLLRIGDRYVPLIVAWNWSRAVSAYAALTPVFLFGLGVLDVAFFAFIQFVVFLFILAYRWFVIRNAASVPGTTAASLLLFELVGAFIVNGLISELYWLFDSGAPAVSGNT